MSGKRAGAKKPPEIHIQYSRRFLFCLDEKQLSQNCMHRKKVVSDEASGAEIPDYVFRARATKSDAERSFLRLSCPGSARPFPAGLAFYSVQPSVSRARAAFFSMFFTFICSDR